MTTAETIAQALRQAAVKLSGLVQADARLEAEILLAHVLDKPRTYLFAWPEHRLNESSLKHFQSLVERRLHGEPSAYLTGYREFWSLEIAVTTETLIPRPETELLVERALHLIPIKSELSIADLGTGSGAVSAAIASERPACRILATDISTAALAVARQNFSRLGLENIHCANGRWCAALPTGMRFDLIVCNPPYVATDDPHLMQDGLPWEPISALISGSDGLQDICDIVATAADRLLPGGWLLLEHGFDQGARVRNMLSAADYRHCRTFRDLGGRDRVSQGQTPR